MTQEIDKIKRREINSSLNYESATCMLVRRSLGKYSDDNNSSGLLYMSTVITYGRMV